MTYEVNRQRIPAQVGETEVEVVTHETGQPGLTYVNMHDDENTAVAATLGMLRRRGGRLVEVRHTGERNLSFELEDTTYTFDPNRIFTDVGAKATLEDLGPYSPEALEATRSFARQLLGEINLQQVIDTFGVIVTVHNNTPGHYSAKSYRTGGEYAREAEIVRHKERTAPDDFFFVTSRDHYEMLRGGPFHVVLQDNAAMTDDGSLSVYAAQQGLPYINVEAQHGHLAEQIRMLEVLNDTLQPTS